MARCTTAFAAGFAVVLAAMSAAPALAGTIKVPSEDHPTIQSAVNAASDGDTILVAAGTYTEGTVVGEKSNLRIRGLPGAVLDDVAFVVINCDRVTIEGFTFVNDSDNPSAVVASFATRLTLKKLTIEGYVGDGIRLVYCTGPKVTGCTVSNSSGGGLRDVDSTDLVVEKCTFTNLADLAIALSSGEGSNSARARVSKNTVNSGTGGIAGEGEDLRVEGNSITLESGNGIALGVETEGPGALVQKNTVATSGFPFRAIDVQGSAATIARNTVTGAVGVGVFALGDGNRIERNAVTGAVQCFNLLRDDLVITGNVATGPLDYGFLVQQGSRAVISKNRVLDGGDSNGIQVTQQDVLLTKNYVEGAYNAFFLGFGPMTLVGNVAVDSTNADLTTHQPASQFTLIKNRFDVVLFDVPEEGPPI
jgi:parallel beta-helix repeat protein